MNRPPTKAASGVRKASNVIVIAIMALGGLALAAGGGYLLLADDTIDLPTSMRQVLAQEATSVASPDLTSAADTDAPSLIIITPTAGTRATTIALDAAATGATATPTATYVVEVRTPVATASVALSPTPTRIVRVTSVATATSTPEPESDELPDTGFGDFLQPLAGLGLASLALVTHAIRRRR